MTNETVSRDDGFLWPLLALCLGLVVIQFFMTATALCLGLVAMAAVAQKVGMKNAAEAALQEADRSWSRTR